MAHIYRDDIPVEYTLKRYQCFSAAFMNTAHQKSVKYGLVRIQ